MQSGRVYIHCTIAKNMGRAPKPHIPLNPVIMRYLEDIEDGFQARQKDKTIEPREVFLIHTISKGETYPQDHDKALVAFKRYFAKERALAFPSLKDFAKRYGFNWKASDVVDSTQIGRNDFVSYEKFFPVQVVNIEKVQGFHNKYRNSSVVEKEVDVPTSKTTYNPKTRTVSKDGVKSYSFQDRNKHESWRIFTDLWENRKHIVNGKIEKQGKEDNFANVAARTGIAHRDVLRVEKNRKRMEQKVRNVIKSLTRKARFPMKLTCGKNKVLLTVRD